MIRKLTIIVYACLTLVLVISGWLGYSGQLLISGILSDFLLALGRLAGLLAVYGILWQLIFVSRFSWFEQAFSLDKTMRWHHLCGLWSGLMIVLHPILLVWAYAAMTKVSLLEQFVSFVTGWEDVFKALLGTILFIIAIVSSIYMVKKHLKYELWYLIHVTTYGAILLTFGHQLAVGGDFIAQNWFRTFWIAFYLLMVGILVFYRLLKPLYQSWRYAFKVEKVVMEKPQIYSIYIVGRRLDKYLAHGGQFIIVRFLAKRVWWQAHPFSLSALPDGLSLRLTIKVLGDFTKELQNIKAGTRLIIDGPHGAMTHHAMKTDKALLIAGGIGITPLRSLAESLIKQNKNVILFYAARSEAEFVLLHEFDSWPKDKFSYHLFCSQAESPVGPRRNVTKEAIMELVPDFNERDIYVCGPKPMMDLVRQAVFELGLPKARFHWENFSL